MKIAPKLLVLCVGALLTLGVVILYSASMGGNQSDYLLRQLLWCGLGIVACAVLANLDYRILKPFCWPIFVVSVGLLVLVFSPLGESVKGARRWIDLGVIQFQPSEIAKLAMIVILAHYASLCPRKMTTFFWGTLIPGVLVVTFLGPIIFEPDYSTTLLLGGIAGAMLLVAGVRLVNFLPPGLAGLGLIGYWIFNDPERWDRISGFIHLEETKQESGYQAYQAMLALGSGGWTGVGLGEGRQKLGYVPEHLTDFIFSIIGEELGLIATLSVTATFIVVIICGACIAAGAKDTFGGLLAAGITFLIGFQAFINIGVVTSALPNTGIPLPFISYGGSNLLILLSGIGILVSIAKRGNESEQVNLFASELEEPEIAEKEPAY